MDLQHPCLTNWSRLPGYNLGATREDGEPYIAYGATTSVWYKIVSPSSGVLVVTVSALGFNPVVVVWADASDVTSLGSSLSTASCTVDVGSCYSIAVTAGTAYAIVVDGYYGGSGMTQASRLCTPCALFIWRCCLCVPACYAVSVCVRVCGCLCLSV